MALQGSGPISISQIRTELGNVSYSLRTLSAAASKAAPDAMSEFYGFSAAVSVDYLVIAGGGGGGWAASSTEYGGGGGAGGYKAGTINLNRNTSYTITVGAGAGPQLNDAVFKNGSPSSISSLVTTTGGGGGAGSFYFQNIGNAGGSGGGSVNDIYNITAENRAAGIAGEGNAGGAAPRIYYPEYDVYGDVYGAGGGGGAGSPGGDPYQYQNQSYGGNGGSGIVSSINGTATGRGGGGGGGGYNSRGLAVDGGGGGPGYNPSTSGVANTGGGGAGNGGPGSQITNGSGGSGVVIIRTLSSVADATSYPGGVLTTYSGYKVYTFNGNGSITF